LPVDGASSDSATLDCFLAQRLPAVAQLNLAVPETGREPAVPWTRRARVFSDRPWPDRHEAGNRRHQGARL